MLKSVYVGGLALVGALLLAACGAVTGDPPPAPVEAMAAVEEEMVPTEEPVAETGEPAEELTVAEEAALEEETVEEEVAEEEMAPTGEEIMPEEVVTAEPVEVPTEAVMTGPEEAVVTAAETMAEEVAAAPVGPTEEQQQLLAGLTVKGSPPELHNELWLNSEPLKLEELRGKVVIVEFWTFG